MNTEVSEKQIKAWKEEHGNIYKFIVGEKVCYLRKPTRRAISYASVAGQTDPLKYNEILLDDCWIAGDEEIKTDNGLFLSISNHLAALVEIKEVEMVKL